MISARQIRAEGLRLLEHDAALAQDQWRKSLVPRDYTYTLAAFNTLEQYKLGVYGRCCLVCGGDGEVVEGMAHATLASPPSPVMMTCPRCKGARKVLP